VWTGLIWLRIDTVTGSCKQVNESLGSMKDNQFLEYMCDLASQRRLLHAVCLFVGMLVCLLVCVCARAHALGYMEIVVIGL
jgi:hypothetical protein